MPAFEISIPALTFSFLDPPGEEVAVWIMLKPNKRMDEQQLKAICKGKVS